MVSHIDSTSVVFHGSQSEDALSIILVHHGSLPISKTLRYGLTPGVVQGSRSEAIVLAVLVQYDGVACSQGACNEQHEIDVCHCQAQAQCQAI